MEIRPVELPQERDREATPLKGDESRECFVEVPIVQEGYSRKYFVDSQENPTRGHTS